jgi:hypothetical protein
MRLKGLAIFAVLFVVTQAPLAVPAIAQVSAAKNPAVSSSSAAQPHSDASSSSATGSDAGIHNDMPHISVADPSPVPAAWTMHERIAWAANLVLVLLGYAGFWMALSLLKKIQHQTASAEIAAEAAAVSAQAALLQAQAIIHAERPWILISVEPSRSKENSFTVMATNRGRSPARIVFSEEEVIIANDESQLPIPPEYESRDRKPKPAPILLLPGEFTPVKPFCRTDVKDLCDSEERFKRIETWEEKLYLYGRVTYKDLMAPDDSPVHETNWCCWYIHGRQNSGLVIAGPPVYNQHT